MAYNGGKLANLINPEVMGEYLDYKMMDAIKFAPLCKVDTTLQGHAGDTLTLPKYAFVGLATDVAEGEDIPLTKLEASKITLKVKKAGKGIQETEEALISSYGDPEAEISKQLLMAVTGKIDNDVLEALKTASLVHVASSFGTDVVADALVKFGEDLDEEKFLFISPAQYAAIRKDENFTYIQNGIVKITGHVGDIYGCNVVVSNKVTDKEAFIVKPGALGLLMKKQMVFEYDKDIINQTHVFVATEHFVAYLRDESKAVKITIG